MHRSSETVLSTKVCADGAALTQHDSTVSTFVRRLANRAGISQIFSSPHLAVARRAIVSQPANSS